MSRASQFKFRTAAALLLASAAPHHAAQADGVLLLAEIIARDAAPARQAQMLVPLRAAAGAVAAETGKPSILRLNNANSPPKNIELADADAGSTEEGTEQGSETAPIGEPVEPLPAVDAEPWSGAVDPDFKKWQREADEKLKDEDEPKSVEHPLTKDHPQEFIIVCEAGCRGRTPDEIVSRIAKPERLNSASRSFDPTSSGSQDLAAPPDEASPAPQPEQDPSTISCEAGCYGRTRMHKARLPRRAAADSIGASQHPGHRIMIAPQTAVNGAIVGPHFALRHVDASPSAASPSFKPTLSETPAAVRSKRASGYGKRVALRSKTRRRLAEYLN